MNKLKKIIVINCFNYNYVVVSNIGSMIKIDVHLG